MYKFGPIINRFLAIVSCIKLTVAKAKKISSPLTNYQHLLMNATAVRVLYVHTGFSEILFYGIPVNVSHCYYVRQGVFT